MAAASNSGARLSRDDMRFVKFVGKCVNILPGFTDSESAFILLEYFSDWYHVIEKHGLAQLPATCNPARKTRTKKVLVPPGEVGESEDQRRERVANEFWRALEPSDRYCFYMSLRHYLEKH